MRVTVGNNETINASDAVVTYSTRDNRKSIQITVVDRNPDESKYARIIEDTKKVSVEIDSSLSKDFKVNGDESMYSIRYSDNGANVVLNFDVADE